MSLSCISLLLRSCFSNWIYESLSRIISSSCLIVLFLIYLSLPFTVSSSPQSSSLTFLSPSPAHIQASHSLVLSSNCASLFFSFYPLIFDFSLYWLISLSAVFLSRVNFTSSALILWVHDSKSSYFLSTWVYCTFTSCKFARAVFSPPSALTSLISHSYLAYSPDSISLCLCFNSWVSA